jgi:putative ABC transport system permease protein
MEIAGVGDIWKIKTIYWRNNVMGFAPFLYQIVTARSEKFEQQLVLAGTYFNRTIHIPD